MPRIARHAASSFTLNECERQLHPVNVDALDLDDGPFPAVFWSSLLPALALGYVGRV